MLNLVTNCCNLLKVNQAAERAISFTAKGIMTSGTYRRILQDTAGYLYIKTFHFIFINFIARKYFMDI